MNERIKELVAQARIHSYVSLDGFSRYDVTNHCLEKFAELIVRECLEVVERQFGGGNGDGVEWDRAVDFTYNDVKKHFGVEE